MRLSFSTLVLAVLLGIMSLTSTGAVAASNVGPKKCQECHRAEHGVWEGSAHFKAFRGAHKAKGAKEIAAASGGGKSMRRNQVCVACHYTEVGGKPKAGPSCESCHGGASEWLSIHNDKAMPKEQRLAAAKDAGMIHSSMLFEIAQNCNGCHTMQNVDPAMAGKLIDAGHPINGDYELVKYSQGQVRHRFYPPDVTVNQEMSKSELANMFLTGHAVGLVYATNGIAKSDNAKYKAEMQKRVDAATKALGAVKGQIPAASKLLSSPNEGNARSFITEITGKDLSAAVGAMLPSSYK
jgi:cytochrome c2